MPRHHRGAAAADSHAVRARAAQQAQQAAKLRGAAARQRLLAAQDRTARDLAAQRLAAAQASQDRAQAIALSTQARASAAHLRETETRAADTLSRIETLEAHRRTLQAELARDAAALAPMLPLIERLSLYPSETLLASPARPADALTGLMLLRGLGAQLEARAEAIRTRQFELAKLTASLEAQNDTLAALKQEQVLRGRQVSAEAERAAAIQSASQDAADTASRQAAASASRAASLRDAVSRIEALQHAAEAQFQREAAAADRARSAPPTPRRRASLQVV